MQKLLVVWVGLMAAWVHADLKLEGGYVRGLPPGQANTAAFMSLFNTGDKAISISSISSDAAEQAQLHTSQQQAGMMHMRELKTLQINAGSRVELKPGSHHLMLLGLYKPLREGDNVSLNFILSDGSQLNATLPVRSVLNEPAVQTEHQHH